MTQLNPEPLVEGKTKKVVPVSAVRLVAKDDITAGDGARHDVIHGKAVAATRTTSNVFTLLRECDLNVAFYGQDSPASFVAPACRMLPWEVVVRGEAHGSYLKRNPGTDRGQKFEQRVVEFYLKTKGRTFTDLLGGEHALPCDDPLALFGELTGDISLYRPDRPVEKGAELLTLMPEWLFEDLDEFHALRNVAATTALEAFDILHLAWQELGYELVDMKVEFGFDEHGSLLLADVIDNDSWRLVHDGAYVDKQRYREGDDLDKVFLLYVEVMEQTEAFRDLADRVQAVRSARTGIASH